MAGAAAKAPFPITDVAGTRAAAPYPIKDVAGAEARVPFQMRDVANAQCCANVSGGTGQPNSRAASLYSELRECLGRNCVEHLWSGHLGAQSCEDVSGETCQTTSCGASWSPKFEGSLRRTGQITSGQSISDSRVAGMSWKTNWTTSRAASRSLELRRRRRRSWPNHLSRGSSEPRVARLSQAELAGQPRSQHLRTQSCENVSGETAWNTSGQGIFEPRIARMCQAKLAGQPRAGGILEPNV